MDVAIIGAGFCGLATAWELLEAFPSSTSLKITLFDSRGVGKGASGVSAGLLHPFSGAHAKLNWRGREGVEATKKLLEVSAGAISRPVSAKNQGILRPALTSLQHEDFQRCALLYPLETEWLDVTDCQQLAPGTPPVPALRIKEGLTIYSSLYLEGLRQACVSRGVQFKQQTIQSLDELPSFDLVIVTAGAECLKIFELSHLSLKMVKGQVLELAWPPAQPPLPCALNSQVYIVMTEEGKSCLVGATYEKGFAEAEIDIEAAKKDILPKAFTLYPPLKEALLLKCSAGMRAVTPQHLPLMQRLSSTLWVLTGMGSKGLLYHALFAKELAQNIRKERR